LPIEESLNELAFKFKHEQEEKDSLKSVLPEN
jgi:hypothetical protein